MWQSTGVTLTAGQPVTITASGTWSDAGVALTAAGHPSVTVAGTNSPYPPGAPLLSLIGRIGPAGAPFLIGTSSSFTRTASGILYLAPQDNWYTLWDNAGSRACRSAGARTAAAPTRSARQAAAPSRPAVAAVRLTPLLRETAAQLRAYFKNPYSQF